jgi:diacylglycerol kinase (ATP)
MYRFLVEMDSGQNFRKMREPFSWKKRFNSFTYAGHGLKALFSTEHNTWIHAASTLIVLALSAVYNISATEWCLVVIVIGMVWVTETINTAIEKMMDHITPQKHPVVKLVKDLSAAAVLISAVAAAITGSIIFIPKIF